MYKLFAIFILLLNYEMKSQCFNYLTYDFQKDFDILFHQNLSTCHGLDKWTLGYYNKLLLTPVNTNNTAYLKPSGLFSCTSSFEFFIQAGSTIEVNGYADPKGADFIHVLIQENIGNIVYNITETKFQLTTIGYFTVKVDIIDMNSKNTTGYVCI